LEYELKVLEHIITIVLNPSRIKRDNLNDEFLSECKLHADAEKERIRKQFTLMAFGVSQESHIESYYQKHQAILIQLADTAFKYIQPDEPESIYRLTNEISIIDFYKEISIIDFYKEISRIPEELLYFMKMNFPEYFDIEKKLPDAKRGLMLPEIKRNLKLIKNELGKFEIESNLIKITCSPFEDYLSAEKNITYRDFAYLKELQRELISFIGKKNKVNANEDMRRQLLYLNFNRLSFFNYYISHIEEEVKNCNTIPELIEFYSLKTKLINQQPMKPGLVLKPGLPSIKEQVGSWICEELYYIEKRHKLLSKVHLQKNEEPSNESKIHTSLSVSHLALAVKLLVESKMITNTNSTELMRIVARNFKTDKQEVISEDSLRNKSYNFETATVSRLKDEIIGLMNLARKY